MHVVLCSVFVTLLRPPISTLFPYTTLFRSDLRNHRQRPGEPRAHLAGDHQDRVPAAGRRQVVILPAEQGARAERLSEDRKSTRLNSSHRCISYAVFCLKKKKKKLQRARI